MKKMGLSNKAQAIAIAVSSGLIAFGTASATIPNFMPPDIKVPIALVSWLAGVIGFSIKEALGGQAPTPTP